MELPELPAVNAKTPRVGDSIATSEPRKAWDTCFASDESVIQTVSELLALGYKFDA